ncbi:flagellar export chaperone FlgN [bacterium]|nr:flagellar export chaperone FlgN [bacterium]
MGISRTLPGISEELVRLEDVLKKQLETVDRLRQILDEKQKLLLAWRTDLLDEIVLTEDEAFSVLDELERARIDITVEIAKLMEAEPDITLAQLIDFLGLPAEHPLTSLGARLLNGMDEVREMNSTNAFLAQNMVDYTSFVLRLFTQESDKTKYGADGTVESEGIRRSILDREA